MRDTISTLYSDEDTRIIDYGIDVPDWIEQDVTAGDVAAIMEGGCASAAYMPAVTYHRASATMADHGDDVLEYITDHCGELPAPHDGESWLGIAVHYLALAVELWVDAIADEVCDAIMYEDEDEDEDEA